MTIQITLPLWISDALESACDEMAREMDRSSSVFALCACGIINSKHQDVWQWYRKTFPTVTDPYQIIKCHLYEAGLWTSDHP